VVDLERRSLIIGAGSVAAASWLPRARGAGRAVEMPPELRSLISLERDRIDAAMASEDIPGAAVCLLYQGRPVWVESLGITDTQSRRGVGPATVFSIQSTSKNFTATAIMLAVQRGLVELDKPITDYLEDFTIQSRFEPMPQRKMTLRLLLSHRAGFTHEAPVGNNFDPAFPDFAAHVRSFAATWLRYPVGERYRYSNLGVDLAGYILQRVSGKSFSACLKSLIFDPLGMLDSTVATEVYAQRSDRAIGHEKGYTAVPLKTPLIPSGGVYTSARDMANYLAFHLGRGRFEGKKLLEESLWREMHSFSLGGDYGLGVIRTELRYGDTPIRMLNHRGGGFGFGCVCNYCPEAEVGWMAMFNRPTAGAYQFGAGLIDSLLTRRYGAQRASLPLQDLSAIELQPRQLAQFAGSYVGRDFYGEIKLENGMLGIRAAGAFTPLRFTSPVDLFVAGPAGEAIAYRYFPAVQGEPAHLECAVGENSLDYNDGPDDPAGPNSAAWDAIVGEYHIDQWGKPAQRFIVRRKNGYLYLNDWRLVEFEPNLFFTADGEAVDFRRREATWRNIRLVCARAGQVAAARTHVEGC
jgi:CubicO group peptidase (beta-lactamase class C family)